MWSSSRQRRHNTMPPSQPKSRNDTATPGRWTPTPRPSPYVTHDRAVATEQRRAPAYRYTTEEAEAISERSRWSDQYRWALRSTEASRQTPGRWTNTPRPSPQVTPAASAVATEERRASAYAFLGAGRRLGRPLRPSKASRQTPGRGTPTARPPSPERGWTPATPYRREDLKASAVAAKQRRAQEYVKETEASRQKYDDKGGSPSYPRGDQHKSKQQRSRPRISKATAKKIGDARGETHDANTEFEARDHESSRSGPAAVAKVKDSTAIDRTPRGGAKILLVAFHLHCRLRQGGRSPTSCQGV